MLESQIEYEKDLNIFALGILSRLGYEPIYEDGFKTGRKKKNICGIVGLKDDDGKVYYPTKHIQYENVYGSNATFIGKQDEKITISGIGNIKIEFKNGLIVETSISDKVSDCINIKYGDSNGEEKSLWFTLTHRETFGNAEIFVYESENEDCIFNMYYKKTDNQDLKDFYVYHHKYNSEEVHSYEDCSLDMLVDSIKTAVKDYKDGEYFTKKFEAGLEVIEPALELYLASFKNQWAKSLFIRSTMSDVSSEEAAELRNMGKALSNDVDGIQYIRKNKKDY